VTGQVDPRLTAEFAPFVPSQTGAPPSSPPPGATLSSPPLQNPAPPTSASERPAPAAPPGPEGAPRPVPGDTSTATAAGSLLAGRYRLRTRVGSDAAAGAEFWRAEDTVLRRDVAATVLRRFGPGTDPDDDGGAARAEEIIAKALRSGSFEHPGCARLLDVLAPGAPGLPDGVLGAAVAEWVPGRSLAEAVADGIVKPLAAARALQPLAAAAEAAHRHGLVLGCDHPQRVRVTNDGRTQMGFALPRPELTPADDVRGLGAVLYCLLTAQWPLSPSDAARAGLNPADRAPEGAPVSPSAVRPGVPVELETLVVGTLGANDAQRVRTAAAVRSVVDDVVAEADRVVLFPPDHDGVPPEPGDVWQPRDTVKRPADPRRRRKLLVGMAGLGLCVLGVGGYASAQLGSLFSTSTPPIVVAGSSVPPSGAQSGDSGGAGAPAGDAAVKAVGAAIYDRAGDQDNAGRVSRVIDGDPATGWKTFNYRQQFPALKPGVGVMTSFASPVQLSGLTIDSPSPGTQVEIRAAPSPDAALADTLVLARTTLDDGVTTVSLSDSQPVQYVLVWITHLGGGGSDNSTEIREVSFRRVAD
jgi:hypothetical protein